MESGGPANFHVRSFRTEDAGACAVLYREGLIGGQIADNDTGLDIDDIARAYLSSPTSHFWVAETQGERPEVVGMIGVQQHEDGIGEIRRLRVRGDHRRRGIGKALVETALDFCRERGFLKVTLDTYMEREPAIGLFEKFQFRHTRTRSIGGKDIMHFYLDLYHRPGKEAGGSGI